MPGHFLVGTGDPDRFVDLPPDAADRAGCEKLFVSVHGRRPASLRHLDAVGPGRCWPAC
jgi:hypothetical protein